MNLEEYRVAFFTRLEELVQESRLSRCALAKATTIGKNSFYTILKRKKFPILRNVMKLSEFFDVSIDYMLCRTNIPELNGGERESNLDSIITRLRYLIYARDIKLKELQKSTGIKMTRIIKNIKEGYLPSIETLLILSDYFEVSVDYIVGYTDKKDINEGVDYMPNVGIKRNIDFGKRVSDIRNKKRLTMKGLAEVIGGTSRYTISAIEKYSIYPHLYTFIGLANALEVSCDYLLCKTDNMYFKKEDVEDTLSQRLLKLRLEQDISISELCEFIEMTIESVTKHENNITVPKLNVVETYADFYGVSLDYILCRTNNKEINGG